MHVIISRYVEAGIMIAVRIVFSAQGRRAIQLSLFLAGRKGEVKNAKLLDS